MGTEIILLWAFPLLGAAAAPWAPEHGADEPCKTCRGERTIVCPSCDGKWGAVVRDLPCKREKGAGCDGRGYRECFACGGTAWQPCQRCGGDGKLSTEIRERRGMWEQQKGTRDRECDECWRYRSSSRAPGKIPCDKCGSVDICTKCKRLRGGACACEKPRDYTQSRAGMIECPRCKGTGTYRAKAKCPDCEKGRAACPECVAKVLPKKEEPKEEESKKVEPRKP